MISERIKALSQLVKKDLIPALDGVQNVGGATTEVKSGLSLLEFRLRSLADNPESWRVSQAKLGILDVPDYCQHVLALTHQRSEEPDLLKKDITFVRGDVRFTVSIPQPGSGDLEKCSEYNLSAEQVAIRNMALDERRTRTNIFVNCVSAHNSPQRPGHLEFRAQPGGIVLRSNPDGTVGANRATRRGKTTFEDLMSHVDTDMPSGDFRNLIAGVVGIAEENLGSRR